MRWPGEPSPWFDSTAGEAFVQTFSWSAVLGDYAWTLRARIRRRSLPSKTARSFAPRPPNGPRPLPDVYPRPGVLIATSISPGQLQPLAGVEVPNLGCLFHKRVVNALVIYWWRLWSSISVVVARNEVLPNRVNRSRKADLLSSNPLKKDSILHAGNLSGVLIGAVPENENGRDPFH